MAIVTSCGRAVWLGLGTRHPWGPRGGRAAQGPDFTPRATEISPGRAERSPRRPQAGRGESESRETLSRHRPGEGLPGRRAGGWSASGPGAMTATCPSADWSVETRTRTPLVARTADLGPTVVTRLKDTPCPPPAHRTKPSTARAGVRAQQGKGGSVPGASGRARRHS